MYRALHEGWTMSAVTAELTDVPATVPGCVHTDLLAAGLIEDPYPDDNETRLGWIGRTGLDATPRRSPGSRRATTGWTWSARAWTPSPRSSSTASSVGRTANMHRTYRSRRDRRAPRGRATRCGSCSPRPTPMPKRCADRLGARPGPTTTSRSRSSARWPATSAGTGGRPWSPPASGGRSACTRGRAPDWPRSGRTCVPTASDVSVRARARHRDRRAGHRHRCRPHGAGDDPGRAEPRRR